MENTTPTAGPVENALSANVSEETYLAMMRATEGSTLEMGFAAVMTGVMDGLARFVADFNLYEVQPGVLAEMIAGQMEHLLEARVLGQSGNA